MQGALPPASPPSFTAFHSVILGPKNNTPLCTPLGKILVTGLDLKGRPNPNICDI